MDRLYNTLLEHIVPKMPEHAAGVLAENLDGIGQERDRLIGKLLDAPLSAKAAASVVDAVRGCELTEEQRVSLAKLLLAGTVPRALVPSLTDAVIRGKPLRDQRAALLEYLLAQPVPAENVLAMTAAVAEQDLDRDLRQMLLEKLLSQPVPAENVPAMTAAVAEQDLDRDLRQLLLEKLLTQPVPAENVPAMTAAVTEQDLDRDLRQVLLEKLLAQPVPTENIPAMVQIVAERNLGWDLRQLLLEKLLAQPVPTENIPAMVQIVAERNLGRDQRQLLLEKLLAQPVSAEVLPAMTAALIEGRPRREQRAALLEHLLSCPIESEQALACFKAAVEYAGGPQLSEITDMARRLERYRESLVMLRRWVDPERAAWREGQKTALYRAVVEGEDLETVFLDMLCEGNLCYLADACIEFIDRKQLWLMFQEILFEEEYYCEFDTDEPYILDGGVNIGLAIYYAKHRYPKARIVGFEPWHVAYECAVRNVERNGWENVTIHHAALGPKESVMQLVSMMENSLASTLTNRMDDYIEDKHIQKLVEDVDVVPLSRYMDGPVDLLKMDIEGMEAQVLRECGEKLRQVKWLFCEYHFGPELEDNSLVEILTMLENNGFDFEVGKSTLFAKGTRLRPFMHVGKRVSELVWARLRKL